MHKRRRIWGYTDMGRPNVPPLPNFIVMEDRLNGTPYVLTFTGTAPGIAFALSATLPTTLNVTRYGRYAGPYLNGTQRLFISGGVLQSEPIASYELPVYNARVLALRGFETTCIEITYSNGALVYTNFDL